MTRPAESGDIAAVAEFRNAIIRDTTITFSSIPKYPKKTSPR